MTTSEISLPCNYRDGDFYDEKSAEHAINFIENYCSHVKAASGRFILEDWQKDDIIRPLFGWKREDGLRKYRTCYIEIPRKNGKSSLTAAIALYMLTGLNERGAEIISAAGDSAQAAIVFDVASGMVQQSKTLTKACKIYRNKITFRNSFYKSISSEAKTKHGFNCSGVVFDELHTQPNRELWDVLTTSVGSRKEPLIIALTTAGHDTASICYEQHVYAKGVLAGSIDDPTYLPVIYAADPDDPWDDEEIWKKANPGYGTICNRDYFIDQRNKAKANPSNINTFKRLNLNIWTGAHDAWISDEEFMKGASPLPPDSVLEKLPCYGGLDLASTRDLTAFAMVWYDEDRYYLKVHQFVNSEAVENRSSSGGVDYTNFERDGDLTITDGNVTDYDFVKQYIVEAHHRYNLLAVGYDRKFSTYITPQLEDEGVPMYPFGQGFYDMSYPTKQMEMGIVAGRLFHGGNRCLRWQFSCVILSRDPADNIKVTKNKNKAGQMVDGVVASIMAFGEMLKDTERNDSLEIFTL